MSENKMETEVTVGGFRFFYEDEARQAEKENEGVDYIRSRTDMDDPETVLQIYNKIIQQNLFETTVGYSYLKELQEYLMAIPFIEQGDILPIPVHHKSVEEHLRKKLRAGRKNEALDKKKQAAHADYKQRFHAALFAVVALAVCIVAMFVVTATANNATILNYETKIIDRYEHWEQELKEREDAVKEREAELGITDFS